MGIVFETGGALHVRDTIVRKSSRGLEFFPISGNPELYVSDSVFADSSGTGFDVKRGQVTLDRVRVENSADNGMTFSTGSVAATVRDSVSSGNGLVGIRADAGGGT